MFLLVGLIELFLVKRWRWKRGLVWFIVLQAGKWRGRGAKVNESRSRSDPVGQSEDTFTIHQFFFMEPRGFILIRWWLHKQLRLNMIMASNFSAGVLDGLLLGVKLLAWQQIQFCGFAYAALIH